MKCVVCNATLTDYECSLRHGLTKQFLDTCMDCIKAIGNIPVQGNNELLCDADTDVTDTLLDDDSGYIDDSGFEDDYYKDLWDER